MRNYLKFDLTIGGLVIILAMLGLVMVGFYKYNEYVTVKNYQNLYNKSWDSEFKLTDTSNSYSNDLLRIFEKDATKSADVEEYLDYSEELVLFNLIENNSENYLKTIINNRDSYKNRPIRERFIFGKVGYFINSIRQNQLNYYDKEVKRAEKNIAIVHFYQNLYPVLIDYDLLNRYDQNGVKNKDNFADYFHTIQSLEKYTVPNYKFDNEETIKQYQPKAYDVLDKYRRYISSYYSVVKDFVAGDLDSASYKYSSFQDNQLNLAFDWDNLFKNRAEDELVVDTIEIVRNGSKLVKEFEEKYLFLPFVKGDILFDEDLVICQLYDFKLSFYVDLKQDYPVAKTTDELITEMSTISPRTDELDKLFDKKTMSVINNDDEIVVLCKGLNGYTYRSTMIKQD